MFVRPNFTSKEAFNDKDYLDLGNHFGEENSLNRLGSFEMEGSAFRSHPCSVRTLLGFEVRISVQCVL